MRGASLGFMNIISQVYHICTCRKFYFVQNLSIEFLCAELQISCEFLLVETNIYLHTQREPAKFSRSVVLNFAV